MTYSFRTPVRTRSGKTGKSKGLCANANVQKNEIELVSSLSEDSLHIQLYYANQYDEDHRLVILSKGLTIPSDGLHGLYIQTELDHIKIEARKAFIIDSGDDGDWNLSICVGDTMCHTIREEYDIADVVSSLSTLLSDIEELVEELRDALPT